MKNIRIYKSLIVLFTATIFFIGCTKEQADLRLDPTIKTSQILNLSSDSVTVEGFVVAEGDGFTEKGVCFSGQALPTTSNNKVIYTGADTKAAFKVTLHDLDYASKYYARAYGIGPNGTYYSQEVSFTTLPVVPFLTTAVVTEITGNSATGGGSVTETGGADVTAYGLCWGIVTKPTVADSHTTDGTGTGDFVSSLTSLRGNTLYYVRAYATNSVGTGYGPEVTFTTLVDLPTVTTTAVTEITKVSAMSGGEVTFDGGATVTARGLVWSTVSDPTTNDNVIAGGSGTGIFESELTGLTLNTDYHVRAFATNSAGTAYGSDVSFTTLADITKFWVVGSYNGWTNTDAAEYIISTATSAGAAEGYVYLTAGSIKLTTDHSWDDAHTFGDDGSGNLTNPGSDITVSAAGYYLIKANLTDMTYSLTLTTWGVIGSYNGWSSQTDMTYNSASKTFWLALNLPESGEFKFRGTSDWAINYGDNGANGSLETGGDNIVTDLTADYAITLDLSHPNEYTYSVNRWGIIGDATGDASWTTDLNMTWDAVNNVFTATNDMVVGSYKFRANDAWTVNLGGNLSALTQGGDNLSITIAGNYTITLVPWAQVATVTAN